MTITAEQARDIAMSKARINFEEYVENINKLIKEASENALLHVDIEVLGRIYLDIIIGEFAPRGFNVEGPPFIVESRTYKVKISW